MPVFIVQAVQRSVDGSTSVRVISRWPYQADDLESTKAFVDATPKFAAWDTVDAYEVVTPEGKLLAKRPYVSDDWTHA